MLISREQFIARFNQPRQVKEIQVPELGGSVHIRALTGADRERIELLCKRDLDKENPTQRVRVVQNSLCDADGRLWFQESDILSLNTLPWRALDRIADEAFALNGMTDAAKEAAEKNSETPPRPGPSSGPPSTSAASNLNLLSG